MECYRSGAEVISYLEAGNSGTQIQSREGKGLEYEGNQPKTKLIYRGGQMQ